MRTAIDTNILSAIWGRESNAAEIVHSLSEMRQAGSVVISGVVFAEALACPHATEEFVRGFLQQTGIEVDFAVGEDVWVVSGRRFTSYVQRRRNSTSRLAKGDNGFEPKRMLADFLVGAHALLQADCLMTLDRGRYERDFPELRLI